MNGEANERDPSTALRTGSGTESSEVKAPEGQGYTRYCLGFVFRPVGAPVADLEVLLIRKEKPYWQRNQMNGLGGHIEPGETPLGAMRREFTEETGAGGLRWQYVLTFQFKPQLCGPVLGEVSVFRAFTDRVISPCRTAEGWVAWYRVHPLPATKIYNLSWLVPMCLDPQLPGHYRFMEVPESAHE